MDINEKIKNTKLDFLSKIMVSVRNHVWREKMKDERWSERWNNPSTSEKNDEHDKAGFFSYYFPFFTHF